MKWSVGYRLGLLLTRRRPLRRQFPEGSTSYEATMALGPTVPFLAPVTRMPAAQPSMLSWNMGLPFRSLAQSPETSSSSIRKAMWGWYPDRQPRAPSLSTESGVPSSYRGTSPGPTL